MSVISIFHGLSIEAQKQFEQLFKEFPKAVNNLSGVLADNALSIWAERAINKSASYGPGYASTLRIELKGPLESKVYSDEKSDAYKYVKIMEDGIAPWSIRDALLNGPHAKTTVNGIRYNIVPFRWATPSKGSAKKLPGYAGVLSKDIWSAAKEGKRLNKDYGNLSGLKRYGGAKHGQYMTFRMVTDNTQESKWMHPGKTATPVFDEILPIITEMVEKTVKNIIEDFK